MKKAKTLLMFGLIACLVVPVGFVLSACGGSNIKSGIYVVDSVSVGVETYNSSSLGFINWAGLEAQILANKSDDQEPAPQNLAEARKQIVKWPDELVFITFTNKNATYTGFSENPVTGQYEVFQSQINIKKNGDWVSAGSILEEQIGGERTHSHQRIGTFIDLNGRVAVHHTVRVPELKDFSVTLRFRKLTQAEEIVWNTLF